MDPRDIFGQARHIPDAVARARYLAEACAGDAACRAEVEGLLEAFARAGSFLEPKGPPIEPSPEVAATAYQADLERPGTVIGPYKLLQQIGEGGMGVVYMAEQTEPVARRVALKIIKPGMDSRQIMARFEVERHALAMMDHPNIARVLDAGTTSAGRPYFVMELVRGVPITRYCDEHHLTPQARLQLFLPVCHAVQHAHHKGIIHRDIKPGNVLVAEYDDRPEPKIIDFGVAKAVGQRLTEQTVFTQLGQVVGTVEYMSPEQAKLNQLDVDTRSDVYSLGVLLYELLAGDTPFDSKRLRAAAFDELLRIIREEEPPKPSHRLSSSQSLPAIAANRRFEPKKLRLLVRGELDWIVMKAMEKERSRRYETPNALAADVQHYLNDEAVVACPPSAAYRLSKFARRNKALLTTVGLVVAALVLGLTLSTSQWIRARRAEEVAYEDRDRAEVAEQQAMSAQGQALAQRDRAVKSEQEVRQQRDENRRQLYISDLAVALAAWETGDVSKVSGLLERHRPEPGQEDLRGFEWYYLWRALHRSRLAPALSHASPLVLQRFLPDGKTLVTSSTNGQVQFWDLATRQVAREFPVECIAMALAPDGHTLASWGRDKQGYVLKLWNVDTGQQVGSDRGIRRIDGIVFSPDSQRLAFISWHTIKFWEVAEQKLLDTANDLESPWWGRAHRLSRLAISPDGRLLAASDYRGDVVLWDLHSRQPRRLTGEGSMACCVAFSPDSQTVACGSADGSLRLWDAGNGRLRVALTGHANRIFNVAFSPDGQLLASASTTIKLWDVATGSPRGDILAHNIGRMQSVETNSDQATLGEAEGRLVGPIALAFSPDGRSLASCALGTVRLWDLATVSDMSLVRRADGHVLALAFSPDGCTLASTTFDSREIKLWNILTGYDEGVLTCDEDATTVAYSPDGRFLISGHDQGPVSVWEVARGSEWMRLTVPSDSSSINSLAVSPDSRMVAAGNEGGVVRVWDLQTGAMLGSHKGSFFAFSGDGATLAVAVDKDVVLWDVRTNDSFVIKGAFPRGELAYSPDGKILAWGGSGCVHRYDLERRQFLDPLQATLYGSVRVLAFAPQGDTLFTGGVDGTLRVWNMPNGQLQATIRPPGGFVTELALSPDGAVLASSSDDNSIRLWRSTMEENAETLTTALRQEQHLRAIVHATPDEQYQTIIEFAERLQKCGTDEIAHYLAAARSLISCLVKAGHHELAVPASQEIAQAIGHRGDPNHIHAAQGLELLPWRYRYRLNLEHEQWDDAVAAMSAVLERDPYDAGLWAARGGVQFKLSRWSEAVADLTRARELNPARTRWVHAKRGRAHVMLGHWQEAAEDLAVTVANTPHTLLDLEALAVLQLLAGDREAHAQTCRAAFDHYATKNEWEKARVVAICALGNDPAVEPSELQRLADDALGQNDNNYIKLSKAMIDYRSGRFQPALDRLPFSAGPLYAQLALLFGALAHHQLGHTDQARAMLQNAIDTTQLEIGSFDQGPPLPAHLPERWVVWCTIEAVQREAEALIGPLSTSSRILKAGQLTRSNDLAGAARQWTDVLAERPGDIAILRNRGLIYVKMGQWAAARDDFNGVLHAEPSDAMNWLRVASVLALAGDTEALRQHCRNMMEQFGGDRQPDIHEKITLIGLLVPDVVAVSELPLARLESVVDDPANADPLAGWYWTTRALAAYRQGNAEIALAHLHAAEASATYRQSPLLRARAFAVKSLAQRALQQLDQATESLAQATQIIDAHAASLTGDAWHDVLIARILAQEAAQ